MKVKAIHAKKENVKNAAELAWIRGALQIGEFWLGLVFGRVLLIQNQWEKRR